MRGFLKPARWARTCSTTSSSPRAVPGRQTTAAATISPQSGAGTPKTAARSRLAGQVARGEARDGPRLGLAVHDEEVRVAEALDDPPHLGLGHDLCAAAERAQR